MTYEDSVIMKVAWKYYNEGLTQNEIAQSLNLSRMKVIKYLDIAKSKNIIQFKINLHPFCDMDLKNKIKQAYHLQDIYIVPASSHSPLDSLTKAAAHYMEDRIASDTIINVGYGLAVSKTLRHLNISPKYKVSFVSLSGGVGFYLPAHAASPHEHNHYIMPAPLLVSSEQLACQLMQEKPIKRIMEMVPHASATIIGIGALNGQATLVKEGYISTNEIEIYKSMGAVGDLLSQFYDKNGDVLDFPLHKQLISTDISRLKSLNHVIAIASGLEKREAIIGALKGGYIDVLITDEAVAKSLVT